MEMNFSRFLDLFLVLLKGEKVMSKTLAVVLGVVFVFILLPIAIFATSYISANNYGAKVEADLRAARDDNQNILAQYQQKILEVVQVPEMYKEDLKGILTAEMQGRYGSEGSKATFQWLQERALNFDSKLYSNVQDLIAGGRKDFERGQTRMIDIRKGYDAQLGYFWRGMFLRLAGYPKVNMSDFNPITTDRVEETYKNGKESSPLKLR